MASTDIIALNFNVTRKTPEMIPPAKPTPHELRTLSISTAKTGSVSCSRSSKSTGIIRQWKGETLPRLSVIDAVAKVLVLYYPLAGRLREYATRKYLVVECTGEGVVFVEADADVTLQQFGSAGLHPPFPNVEELLPPDAGVMGSPLLLIQVTRLKCGRFIFGARLNHAVCDGGGFFQFLTGVAELARGAEAPSVPPVWERHLLSARYPPRVSFPHHEYDVVPDTKGTLLIPIAARVQRSFFFGAAQISFLRRTLPPHLRSWSNFELVAACTWRFQTIATAPDPDEEVKFLCSTNIRRRLNPPLPDGYYGNTVVSPAVVTTAGKLLENPLHYAVELVMKSKRNATDEYVRSTAEFMVVRGRPSFSAVRILVASYLVGVEEVDIGWGKAAYGGPAT